MTTLEQDIERIKSTLYRIERQMNPELYTIRTVGEANRLFKRLLNSIKDGQSLELIIRKI